MAKLSVAMTTFNGERYIEEQLQSIADQKLPVDEVIICDDCSTDRTVEIVKAFIQERNLSNWRILKNECNLGYIKNFSKAIALAEGDYIFLCDQDDVWEAEKTEVMVKEMEESQVSVLNTAFTPIDGSGKEIPMTKRDRIDNYGFLRKMRRSVPEGEAAAFETEFFVYKNVSPGCTVCFDREIQKAFCELEDLKNIPHDWVINILGTLQKGTVFLNKRLTRYRLHGHNTIGVMSDKVEIGICENSARRQVVTDKMRIMNSIRELLTEIGGWEDYVSYRKTTDYLKLRLSFLEKPELTRLLRLMTHPTYYRIFFSRWTMLGDAGYYFRLDRFKKG